MRLRSTFLALATVVSMGLPVAASACGTMNEVMGTSFMSTPVSAQGRFVYVTRVSRRTLKHRIAEQRLKLVAPLPREIL